MFRFDDDEDLFKEIIKRFQLQQRNLWKAMQEEGIEAGEPITFGYRITQGPDGKIDKKIFTNKPDLFDKGGNLNFNKKKVFPLEQGDTRTKRKIDAAGYKEPHTDVMKEEKDLRVIIELPGVAKEDISVKAKDDRITVTAEKGSFKYKKNISLDSSIESSQIKASFKNGILELEAPLKTTDDDQGTDIHIE